HQENYRVDESAPHEERRSADGKHQRRDRTGGTGEEREDTSPDPARHASTRLLPSVMAAAAAPQVGRRAPARTNSLAVSHVATTVASTPVNRTPVMPMTQGTQMEYPNGRNPPNHCRS